MALNIYYQNVRGLKTKLDAIYNEIASNNFDLIFLTETWLNNSVLDSEICDTAKYFVYRRDRCNPDKTQGGGVLILVNNLLKSKVQTSWNSVAEDIWVTISFANNTLHLCSVYIAPSANPDTYTEHFNKISDISLKYPNDDLLIIGDYNLPYIDWTAKNNYFEPTNLRRHNTYLEFVNMMNLCNMLQFNGILNGNNRILDLVLCTTNCKVAHCVSPISNIDCHHPPLEIYINLTAYEQLASNNCLIYNYNKCNYEELIYKLSAINWGNKLSSNNININVQTFYNIIHSLIKIYIPLKQIKKSKYPPWFSKSLIKLIKEKLKFHKRWKTYGSISDYTSFAILRDRVKSKMDKDFMTYINNTENNIKENPRLFWSYNKTLRKKPGLPNSIKYNDNISQNGLDICNAFADFFESVFDDNCDNTHNDHAPNLNHVNANLNLNSVFIEYDCILNHLMSLDITKGSGPDQIPAKFIRTCALYFAEPLQILFNQSLRTGIFPDAWKVSHITPIFKSGDINEATNYRPISILSTFGKIFEALVINEIKNDIFNIIIPEQNGFCPGKSVLTNLVPFTEFLSSNMDKKSQIDVIYTDFSKAFDRVHHPTLISKLYNMGIHGSLLRWIESYITNRSQLVVCNGFQSRSISVTSGVPQGSHLGPLLFNLFINDINSCFKNSHFLLYADDLKFFKTISNEQDALDLQKDFICLQDYCNRNLLSLNASKCCVVNFSRTTNKILFNYNINNENIANKTTIKDLGITFDCKLLFNEHIDLITKQSYKALGFVLRSCKHFRSPGAIICVFNSLVRSKLEYCSTVWNPMYTFNVRLIENIQKKFISVLCFRFKIVRPDYISKLKFFNMDTLENRRTLSDMTFLYKIYNNLIFSVLIVHHFNIYVSFKMSRSNNLFFVFQTKTNNYKNSPANRIMSNYNLRFGHIDLFDLSLSTYKRCIVDVFR